MPTSVASISGLSSGIDWSSIVDQLVAVEQNKTVTPLTNEITTRTAQKTAWTTFTDLTNKMNDAARALRTGGVGGYTATSSLSPDTGRSVVGVSASTTAAPGNYKVEVLQLAQAAKTTGSAKSSTTSALNLAGNFAINGSSISVATTDSLSDVRNKINNANTGSSPTGVTASILSDGGSGGRLVLTRDTAGGSGISVTDGTGGLARELGFVDSRSNAISSTTTAIASALGLLVSPPPASIKVDGHVISVDLSTDSIASIVAKINAAGAQATSVQDTNGASTGFRIATDGNVTADPNDPNSQAVLSALGFQAGQAAAVRQQITSQKFTTANDRVANSSALLTDLKIGGVSANIAPRDAINIRGVRGDGTSVSVGITVDAGDTLQTLVDKINSGYGTGARTAKASLGDDGAIHLTDDSGGDSRLSLNLSVVKNDGSSGTIGSTSVSTVGRQRQVSTSQDAQVRVDGVLLSRSSNTIADAIPGVTLSLQNAEEGTTVDVNVAKDSASAVKAVDALADAYNNIVKFYESQRSDITSPLYGNSSLRSTVQSFTNALRTSASGNGTYSSLSIAGVSLDRYGQLQVDDSKLKTAFDSKPSEMEALLGSSGVGQAFVHATDAATSFGQGSISTAVQSIDNRVVKLQSQSTEATQRLAVTRADLIARYAQLESTLSSLKGQGTYLTSAIANL